MGGGRREKKRERDADVRDGWIGWRRIALSGSERRRVGRGSAAAATRDQRQAASPPRPDSSPGRRASRKSLSVFSPVFGDS